PILRLPPQCGPQRLSEHRLEIPCRGGYTRPRRAAVNRPNVRRSGWTTRRLQPTVVDSPGHISLYLPSARLLIAGDALRVEDGQLLGPNPAKTTNMEEAQASIMKMALLRVDTVVCYHGGRYDRQVTGRLRELAEV
ncbi:metallo-beta-lactamase family protein, partial [mine drainage metagenome]